MSMRGRVSDMGRYLVLRQWGKCIRGVACKNNEESESIN